MGDDGLGEYGVRLIGVEKELGLVGLQFGAVA
jgi:hypothetical protein